MHPCYGMQKYSVVKTKKTGRFYGVKGLYAMGDYAKKYKNYA
ncbi:hypothetical protein XCR1_890008 [Xenorhabdus cabanillasii JM26]|uniref:Uncharacterized protein n=1 Tax=Xenorhabdus cabanillasii JM26 TaxID=1427517 RepID=W1J997_9GAMM|nr:hypothetical protein XCR1_890008 [Xenorhabdus cabanillasii JM26]